MRERLESGYWVQQYTERSFHSLAGWISPQATALQNVSQQSIK